MKPKNTPIKNIPKKTNIIKDSLFARSFILLKSNPYKAGLMVLFDAMFLISAFGLNILGNYFAQSLAVPASWVSSAVFIVFSLAYYLIVLLAYSFFKYGILDFISSLSGKAGFSLKRLGQFYSLNIIIAGIFFAAMIAVNFILAGIRQSYAPFIFIFLAVPYLLFLYAVINLSHSMFYQGASAMSSVKGGFVTAFAKMKTYRETILSMIVISMFLWLLFYGSGYLIRILTSKNYSLYLSAYAYFKHASIAVFYIVFYTIVLINRVSFYAVIRDDK